MFEEKYAEQIDSVMSLLSRFGKGDTVPWGMIEQAIGMHRDDPGGRNIIRRMCRRLLRERSITAFPCTNVGVRLLTDTQAAVEVPAMRQARARRQISRGLRETADIDQSQLSSHTSISLALARRHMKAERQAISRGAREVDALMRPSRANGR